MQFEIKSNTVKVVLGLEGAMLNSLMKDGIEYLWQGDAQYWGNQAPVCFPIVGVLPGNEGTAFGKKCVMKRHGVARISPFEVLEQRPNSITFVQRSSDATRAAYPFDYELRIKYTIVGDTITNEYIITNTGSDKMPFVIGGHPAFNCPLVEGEVFEDYKVVFDKVLTHRPLRPDHETGLVDIDTRYDALDNTDTLWMKHELFEELDSMIFDNIASKCATLIGKAGRGVRIEYQDMANLLIWSAVGRPNFVALEPWTGISNCSDEDGVIEKKRGMTILESGETTSVKFKITLI